MRNVTKIDASKVTIPTRALREDRGLKLCGEPFKVLASITDSSLPKNDYTLVFEKCDTLQVFTELNGVRSPAIGVAIDIGDNAKGFVIEWRRYNDGAKLLVGCYKVVVTGTIAGIEFEYYQGSYDLQNYSTYTSEGTVQIYSIFNQYSEHLDIDFTGSGARETIRFRGFFGNRQPNYETLNNTHTDRIRNNVYRKTNNTYSLLCEPSFSCVTERIEGLHILDGTLTYISDFNNFNHVEYREHAVILSEDQTPEFDYFEGIGTIYAKVLAQYKDRKSVRNAKFQADGRNVGVPNIGLWIGVVGGGGGTCPDTTLQVNSATQGTFASGSTIDVQLTDGTNPIVPDDITVAGDVVTLEILPPPPPPPFLGWNRPGDLLPMPTVLSTEAKFAGLHAVFPSGNNFCAFSFTTNGGDYQVDWGDGTISTYASGAPAEHQYDFNDPALDGTITTNGFKQAMVIVTPVGSAELRSFNFGLRFTTTPAQNQPYSTGWIDMAISMPDAISNGLRFNQSTSHRNVKRVVFKNIGNCDTFSSLFINFISVEEYVFDCDTSGVTNMSVMFGNNRSLRAAPMMDTQNVTTVQNKFGDCSSLIQMPLYDYSSVTNFVGYISNCRSLEYLPHFNTISATNFTAMCSNAIVLKKLPLFNSINVTNMNNMCSGCESLEELPAFNTTNISQMLNITLSCFSMNRTDIVCRTNVGFQNNQMSREELVNVFNNLLDRSATTSATIIISGNWGASALTTAERDIALNKNWIITG